MTDLHADSPIRFIKGVGPVRASLFAELGLQTVGDLLEYFPFRHETEYGDLEIADLRPGIVATVRGEVRRVRGRWPSFSAEIADGSASCWLRWFDQRYGGQGICVGSVLIATGKVQEYQDRLEIVHPRTSVFALDDELPPLAKPRQVGVYRGTDRLKSPTIRGTILTLLREPHLPIVDTLPPHFRQKRKLLGREAAIRALHEPRDAAAVEQARRRLAYEEFLLLELAMALRRYRTVQLHRGHKLPTTPEIDKRIRARFPFSLTAAQNKVIREIVFDLESGHPMSRLLQGDVGSGKTVVALYACLLAIANGRQATLMAPTEVLAQQHYRNVSRYLEGSRVRWSLLRGGMPAAERRAALRAIERGETELVIGTHALLQRDVNFKKLALVVVDEQHKFGVLQRAGMRTKGLIPHYLVMTATPIPRTLAMTVFGDLDVSVLDASPPGRGLTSTRVVEARQWGPLMADLRRRLENGERAYVVCPIIGADAENGETALPQDDGARKPSELTSVLEMHRRLTRGPWQGLDVGLLHGGCLADEQQATIAAFSDGRLHALVATTVIEVGVDVPEATLVVVEHAERFGLSQLHQLRGRVGRGDRDSQCILISHRRNQIARQRLATMVETTDGFKIAEADLRLRGPGELFGTRQHGLPELRIGNLIDDFTLLDHAREDAFEIVSRDPQLKQPEHAALLPALKRTYGGKLALIDAG
ncbi:MAG: ATP-dependent DNA helicase RecG [Phycisphaerae bacterium]|nr:ATP-dependent DNA helicase RecG [Phycisphaerae bacterium]